MRVSRVLKSLKWNIGTDGVEFIDIQRLGYHLTVAHVMLYNSCAIKFLENYRLEISGHFKLVEAIDSRGKVIQRD